jgi:hypothetical protein
LKPFYCYRKSLMQRHSGRVAYGAVCIIASTSNYPLPMRYHLLILSMLGLLATATQAAAQSAPHEFWTEKSAATGAPVVASPGHSEIAEPVAGNNADTSTTAPPLGQFLLARPDFVVTHNAEPVGAFRRKRKQ